MWKALWSCISRFVEGIRYSGPQHLTPQVWAHALLFLVYINDLPSITCNRCNVSLYADDTVLYCYASDVNDLERNLNEDLLKLAIWLKENKLTLNLNKTRSMIIGSDRKLCNLSSMSVSVSTILKPPTPAISST
jgi:hypothetical protein